MTLACRGFKTESHKLSFIVVTSWVRSSFSASIFEELNYLLKTPFLIFFKIVFVVRSNGFNRCVMFFGTIIDSIFCFDRASDTLAVDWALKASHVRRLFWSCGRPFSSLNFLIYGTRTCSITWMTSFSLLQCIPLYTKQKPSGKSMVRSNLFFFLSFVN